MSVISYIFISFISLAMFIRFADMYCNYLVHLKKFTQYSMETRGWFQSWLKISWQRAKDSDTWEVKFMSLPLPKKLVPKYQLLRLRGGHIFLKEAKFFEIKKNIAYFKRPNSGSLAPCQLILSQDWNHPLIQRHTLFTAVLLLHFLHWALQAQ